MSLRLEHRLGSAIWRAGRSCRFSSEDVAAGLRRAIADRFGVRHSVLTSTGRAGLTVLLKALRRLSGPNAIEVILPSYTCFSVAASVVKAGLVPRIVDISPETLDYSRERLERTDVSRVLAVIATNLYGMPNDLPGLSAFARQRHLFLIDDAAQAMGASVGARSSGTWGDAGLYSLDKGKNVSAIDGGIVVTNVDDIAAALREEMADLPAPHAAESGISVLKAFAYAACLRPSMYWIPNSIPQLGLGQTVFSTDFPLAGPSRPLAGLALTMLDRLDEFTWRRVANATSLRQGLKNCLGVRLVQKRAGAVPVYLRLPLLVSDAANQRRLIDALGDVGIGATGSTRRRSWMCRRFATVWPPAPQQKEGADATSPVASSHCRHIRWSARLTSSARRLP